MSTPTTPITDPVTDPTTGPGTGPTTSPVTVPTTGPVAGAPYTTGEVQAGQNMQASPEVARELAFILKDYASLNAAQQKMDTNLVYAAREAKGLLAVSEAPLLTSGVKVLPNGTVNCDIKVKSSDTAALVQAIRAAGGTVVGVSQWSKNVRAFVPVLQIESLAGRDEVVAIGPAIVPKPNNSREHLIGKNANVKKRFAGVPYRPSTKRSDRKKMALSPIAASVAALPNTPLTLPLFPALVQAQPPVSFGPYFDKEGYYGHDISTAANTYGMTGAGIKIGVISTDVLYLDQVQEDGYLDDVQIVENNDTDGEGTAMLQIVHTVAPDAQLYFATGESGRFADYIVELRDTYGCDIILDDLGEGQPAFSEGDVAQAVNHVTSEGALYFSSAGNQGNNAHYDKNFGVNVLHHDGECWEGDYSAGGTVVDPAAGMSATLHTFTATRNNSTNKVGTIQLPYDLCINGTTNFEEAVLQWSDAYGVGHNTSGNNYFIFTTDATGTRIRSTGLANNYTPYAACQAVNNQRIYVAKLSGAACALRIDRVQDGELGDADTLQLTTAGESDAHNAGRNTLGVAAIDAAGTYNPFSAANNSIFFSSDGPRRLFWTADSAGNEIPVAAGVHTFAGNGYLTFAKPDVTAANGVTTDVPGFAPFYGTSAASPHAGAIAGLILSYGTAAAPVTVPVTTGTVAAAYGTTTIVGRNLTTTEMKTVLESSAMDNNAGLNVTTTSPYDYVGGFGITMPVLAAKYLGKFFDPNTVGVAMLNPTTYQITWNTNLPASSIVHYGTSPTALSLTATGSATASTTHTVQVSSIVPTTRFYYEIETATPKASASVPASVSFIGTVARPLNTLTQSNVVLANLALTRISGGLQAVVTVSNTGAGLSSPVTISATLGGSAGTPATVSLGQIASRQTAKATFTFPTLATGTKTQFILSGTEGNNVISSTTQVQIP